MKRFYPDYVPEFSHEPKPSKFEIVQIGDNIGVGVMSKATFFPGEIVFGFTGFVIDSITQYSLTDPRGGHVHDPFFMGRVLHSCDPNTDCDMIRRVFIARKKIRPGELVTMDYEQTEPVLFKPFTCQCGSPKCRKLIQGSEMIREERCVSL